MRRLLGQSGKVIPIHQDRELRRVNLQVVSSRKNRHRKKQIQYVKQAGVWPGYKACGGKERMDTRVQI